MLSEEQIDTWARDQASKSPPVTEAQLTRIAAILFDEDDHD